MQVAHSLHIPEVPKLQRPYKFRAGNDLWLGWPADRHLWAYSYTFIRRITGQTGLLINTGSVGLPYDSDSRPAYLILDGSTPSIRRVEYNVRKS
jgi:hypothetical protein